MDQMEDKNIINEYFNDAEEFCKNQEELKETSEALNSMN